MSKEPNSFRIGSHRGVALNELVSATSCYSEEQVKLISKRLVDADSGAEHSEVFSRLKQCLRIKHG